LKTAGSQSITATDTASATVTGSTSVTVTPAAATVLQMTAPSTATAGAAFSVTTTALDAYGNTATGFTGTVHFASSDAAATVPGDYTFQASDAGTHTFTSGVTLKTAGSQSVTVSSSGLSSASSTVTVSPATAASLTLTAPATATAGTAFSVTLTAHDAFGNVATGYTGTVHFTSSDGQATLPGDYAFTAADAGTHTFTSVTLATAGSQTVTAADSAASLNGTASVTVSPAAATHFSVTAPATSTAGAAFNVVVTAFDSFGNVATGYTGTVTFASTDSGASLPANYTFTAVDAGTHTFTATLYHAGQQTITATDTQTSSINGAAAVVVSAAAVSTLAVAGPATTGAGSAFSVTVTAQDPYGNVVTVYTGTVHFTSSDSLATLPGDYTFTTADAGTHTFSSGVTLDTAGAQTVTATDTASRSVTGRLSVTVNPGAATHLGISGPGAATAGITFTITLTAFDSFSNVATGYTGQVHFTSSDAQAILPADYTFTAADAGRHAYTVMLRTAGTQSVTATDTATASITGSLSGITVSPAAAASVLVAGYASPTTAGTAHPFTVTFHDAYGNVATGYTGKVHFSSSDGQASLPGDYTFTTADAGTHSFSATLKTAGTESLTATDTAVSSLYGTQPGINVTPAAAATLSLSGPSASTAGNAFSVLVTARDAYGNVAPGYTGRVHFTSSDAQAVLPADYTFTTADAGTHSFSATLKTAGSQSITATDTATASITGSLSGIAVSPAAAASVVVAGYASPTTAGTAHPFTVTFHDAYGNVATGYTGTVHFSSSDGQASLPADYTFTAADAGAHTFSATLKTAGAQSLTAADTSTGSLTGSQTGISVVAAAATTLSLSGPSASTAGSAFSVLVTARDAYGNVATGYTGQVHFTSSDAQAVLPADYTFTTADAGTHSFSATLKTAGSQSITGTDTGTASITGSLNNIAVSPAAASSLRVAGFPSPVTAGVGGTVVVTALDAYGNIATGYAGTVHFSSSDAQASLPADYTFTAADAGTHSFSATLKTAGSQSLTAADTSTASLTGSQTGISVVAAAASTFIVTGFPSPVTAGVAGSFTVRAMDAYGNTATGYTGKVHFTSSDGQASLPADYTFTAADAGTHSFSATLKTAGSQSITVRDTANSSVSGTQAGITVNAAAAARLVLTLPATYKQGVPFTFTVTAVDAYGNVATGYRGKVHFTSSDHKATLPADYTFTAADNGTHQFTGTFKGGGTQTITVTDSANGLSATAQSSQG
jgi:hypothetical protein